MKCRNCGGELLLQDGRGICQSCGSVFAIEGIFEDVDVFICYVESDEFGRRTKDSIIAQEVYQKLGAAKISAFYERISADGISGEDLMAAKYAAMQRAKAVLVLGTSIDRLNLIIQKYGSELEKKAAIPFCVDVNISQIPKTLSKIQAVNYTTIGWEKDLINGLNNLLGRGRTVEAGALYAKSRRIKLLIISAIAILLLVAVAVAIFLRPKTSEDVGEPYITESPAETQPPPPTPKQIYDEAVASIEQGELCEALTLLQQIPEHPDSANKIKLIYAKYEGYYRVDDTNIHLEVSSNIRAEVEITRQIRESVVKIYEEAEITGGTITFRYTDNHQHSGKVEIQLQNNGLQMKMETDSETGSEEILFPLAKKSEQPILQFDQNAFLEWLENEYTVRDVETLGYEVRVDHRTDRSPSAILCSVVDTPITFTAQMADGVRAGDLPQYQLVSIVAPAEWAAPELIGKNIKSIFDGNALYCPNATYSGFGSISHTSRSLIENKTPICIIVKTALNSEFWDRIMQDVH